MSKNRIFIGVIIVVAVLLVIAIVGVSVYQTFTAPGVHFLFHSANLNTSCECYLFDVEKQEIVGTSMLTVNGLINGWDEVFYGYATVDGYEVPSLESNETDGAGPVVYKDDRWEITYFGHTFNNETHTIEVSDNAYIVHLDIDQPDVIIVEIVHENAAENLVAILALSQQEAMNAYEKWIADTANE